VIATTITVAVVASLIATHGGTSPGGGDTQSVYS
jgi:hypothetical protein